MIMTFDSDSDQQRMLIDFICNFILLMPRYPRASSPHSSRCGATLCVWQAKAEAEAAAETQQWAAAIKAHIRYANAETEDNVIRASRRLSGPEASPGLPFVSLRRQSPPGDLLRTLPDCGQA